MRGGSLNGHPCVALRSAGVLRFAAMPPAGGPAQGHPDQRSRGHCAGAQADAFACGVARPIVARGYVIVQGPGRGPPPSPAFASDRTPHLHMGQSRSLYRAAQRMGARRKAPALIDRM